MSKATIISEIGNGQYTVKLIYGRRAEHNATIASLNASIAKLQTQYNNMPETTPEEIFDKNIVGLQIKALEKRVAYLNTSFPADPVFDTWCIDGETGLTGDIGLIEVPGELESTQKTNIVAGYSENSAYDKATHGDLTPPVAMGPWSVFLNKCMLPGWQKWKPLYRYGVIVDGSIDYELDTCDVFLNPEFSSQLNLAVNQNQGFEPGTALTIGGFATFCANNPTHPT